MSRNRIDRPNATPRPTTLFRFMSSMRQQPAMSTRRIKQGHGSHPELPVAAPVVGPEPQTGRRTRDVPFARVVVRLTGVNGVILLMGLITGPVTARVLGVNGRGELAAITAVLTIGPWVLDLGLSQWLARERARGASREDLLGAALPVALGFSFIGAAAAIPLSHVLGQERDVVIMFLQLGLFLMPINVVLLTLVGLAIGESRWGLVTASRVVGAVLPAAVILVLAIVGRLSVGTAAAAYLVGGLLSGLVLLLTVRGVRRLSFNLRRSLTASSFGAKSWLGTVAATANNRLDQLMMAALVPSRELGLYAVAVTVASITFGLIGAVSNALYPLVARGESHVVARSSRLTMLAVAAFGATLATISFWLVPFVFGNAFSDAVPMLIILLLASVPMGGAIVLSAALNAANEPGAAMRAELLALGLTVPALILLLPEYRGIAAALVSLVAYSTRLAVQLPTACRLFDTSYRMFLVPTRGDLVSLMTRLSALAATIRPKHGRR